MPQEATYIQGEDAHVTMEAEIGVRHLQTKECLDYQKLEEAKKKEDHKRLQRQHGPASTLILDL